MGNSHKSLKFWLIASGLLLAAGIITLVAGAELIGIGIDMLGAMALAQAWMVSRSRY